MAKTSTAASAAAAVQYSITGSIYDAFDQTLPNIRVLAYNKDFRSEQLLGEATTDAKGAYTISYEIPRLATSENKSADVFIRVTNTDGVMLGESPVHFNVTEQFVLDFKPGNDPIRGLNEFDTLVNKIKPLIASQKVPIAELKEDDKFKDISFLAGETEESFGRISCLPSAHTLSKQADIPPDIFYGLFRMQFPTTLEELALIKSDNLLGGLQKAIADNIISAKWEPELPALIEKLNAQATNFVLTGKEEHLQRIQLLLTAVLPNADQRQKFLNVFFAHENTPATFWTSLAKQTGFTDPVIADIKYVLQLNRITANVPALTVALFNEQKQNSKLKNLRGLASFTTTNWKTRITKLVDTGALTTFPEGIEGNTTSDKIENYAATLEQKIKALFPLDVFAERMQQDTKDVFNKSKNDLQTFFTKNPDYTLDSNNITSQLKKASFDGVQNQQNLLQELENINRLYKLTGEYSQVATLREANITSASGIALRYGKKSFQQQFAGALGSAETAAEVFRKAKSVHKKASALAVGFKTTYDVPVYAINGPQSATATATIQANLQEMFADATMCSCADCASVYSPAAYFVDILRFLKDESPSAYTELTRRRPDLPFIHLTCANSNTALPYIDLVNELLEPVVAGQPITAFQTTDKAEVLAAYPQNILQAAYTKLNASNAASKLPLSLPLETVRILLTKMGTTRQTLLETFLPNNNGISIPLEPSVPIPESIRDLYRNADVAKEVLQLSDAEVNVLNGTHAIAGKTGNAAVMSIMAETELSYIELLQVLQSYFVNPLTGDNRTFHIVSTDPDEPATCDITKLSVPGMNAAAIVKIIRFRRLQQKLGWTVMDLDRVLTALNITSFDRARQGVDATTAFNLDVIIPLSHIVRLQQRLRLSVQKVTALLYNIDKDHYIDHTTENQTTMPSLYDQLFRDKAVFNSLNPAFKEKALGLSGTITDVANTTTLLTAFKIKQDELTLLLNGYGEINVLLPVADVLSLTNLSILYRRSLLAHALKLSVPELMEAIVCIGINPFTGNFDNTLQFLDHLECMKAEKITVADLKYILRVTIPGQPQAATDDVVTGILEELSKSLKKLAVETGSITLTNNDTAKAIITDKFSSVFKADHATVKMLLNVTVVISATTHTFLDLMLEESFYNSQYSLSLFNCFRHTERLMFLLHKYRLTAEELQFLTQHATKLTIAPLMPLQEMTSSIEDIPFAMLRHFCHYMHLRTVLTGYGPKWYEPLQILLNNQANKVDFINAFSAASGIDAAYLEVLLGNKTQPAAKGVLNTSFPAGYLWDNTLLRVLACQEWAVGIGCSVKDIGAAITPATTPFLNDTQLLKTLEPLLRSRSTEDAWLSLIKPVSNKLRIRKRDALTAFILTDTSLATFRTDNLITDTNSLYEYLLVDVEMDACMYTSRIKQAISSVQLYVNRCLMNLENNVSLGEDFENQWKSWRKQYRVWEANRKIFLYPENWIEPELRDDKSPLFKEVESKLLQNEVTTESVEDAMREYLVKLDGIANLEIIGLFRDTSSAHPVVHVFGRTKSLPRQYYYRKQVQGAWTAWENVDLDIEDDRVLPVVWNNRLMLFWPILTEKQFSYSGSTLPSPGQTVPSPAMYLEIKLAWSEYRNGRWSGKKMTGEFYASMLSNIQKDTICLNSSFSGSASELYISVLATQYLWDSLNWQYFWAFSSLGSFTFGGANNMADFVLTPAPIFWFFTPGIAPGTVVKKMFLEKQASANNLTVYTPVVGSKGFYNQSWYPTYMQLFQKAASKYQLLPEHHNIYNQTNESTTAFFYTNGKNNLYAYSEVHADPLLPDSIDETMLPLLPRKSLPLPETTNNTMALQPVANGSKITAALPGKQMPATITEQAMLNTVTVYKYVFETFYHPFTGDLIKALNVQGIGGVIGEGMKDRTPGAIFNNTSLEPTGLVKTPYPQEIIDFSFSGAYAGYNWELFFHLPLLIATRLSKNQRFEEALTWFHYIFNPTKPATATEQGPERFWITQPFKQQVSEGIIDIGELLTDPDHAEDLARQLEYWEQYPFKPHAVARLRISAYMRSTIIKYIDNLLAWGDQLFARDTIESINEATLLYILAANILGKRPEKVPARAVPVPSSFHDIEDQLNDFSNANVQIQLFIPPSGPNGNTDDDVLMPLFGIPGNDSLLKYWDTVGDRLFKIRHCMNIKGVVRQLPLFEPPIDPALLVRATAMGLDLNSIMNDINAALPRYRFQVMLQKANELCNDVKALGSQLLATLEKKDAEALALLRAEHEQSILDAMRDIKTKQRDEAKENLNSLQASRKIIEERHTYYSTRQRTNDSEDHYLNSLTEVRKKQDHQAEASIVANFCYLVPDLKAGAWSWGITFGGSLLGHAANATVAWLGHKAGSQSTIASRSSATGGFDRRMDDWTFQADTAILELTQVDKQIAAADIRLAIAEKDLQNHDLQRTNTREVDEFMRSKFTNEELYSYMTGQIAAVYFQSYQLAYNTAKQAEKCLQHELGLTNTSYIQFGYWDSLKKGLMSGEKLQYDLRRLENAWFEQNNRELEITKHVSTTLLNPAALLQLREKGICEMVLPEELFDLDFPGHYFRRIKSVSLSIPCIAGPYASVNATLRLTGNEYRINANATNGNTYRKTAEETNQPGSGRFRSVNHIVSAIATSQAQNDSGVFELSFRDERYLPFEGAGASSTWRLELMQEPALRQFDYSTISDVILHIKYTAREGGEILRTAATEHIQQTMSEAAADGMPLSVLFDAKHDYAQAWHQFTRTGQTGIRSLSLPVNTNRLPFIVANNNVQVTEAWLFARKKDTADTANIPFNENQTLVFNDDHKLFVSAISPTTTDNEVTVTVSMDAAEIDKLHDLFVLLKYVVE